MQFLRELLDRGNAQYKAADTSTFNPKMGSQQINVMNYVTPEEEAAVDFNVPKQALQFPVMYVYAEPMSGNEDRQDALKMRRQDRYMTPEHETSIDELVQRSIQKALGYDTAPSSERRRDAANKDKSSAAGHTSMVSRYLRNKNAAIVPLPSSSKLSSMIANHIAQVTGSTPIQALAKQRPNWSAQGAQKSNLPTDDPRGSLEQLQAELDQAEEKYMSLPPPQSDKDRAYADQLEKHIRAVEQRIDNFKSGKHSQKSMYSNTRSNRGKLFYGHFAPTEAAKQLNGKDIIIVDDNVYSGQTFAEAVKALLSAGIKPKSVVGFALHQFE